MMGAGNGRKGVAVKSWLQKANERAANVAKELAPDPLEPHRQQFYASPADQGARLDRNELERLGLVPAGFEKAEMRQFNTEVAFLLAGITSCTGGLIFAGTLSYDQWTIKSLYVLGALAAWLVLLTLAAVAVSRKLTPSGADAYFIANAAASRRTTAAYRTIRDLARRLENSTDLPMVTAERVEELKSVAEDRFRELLLVGEDGWVSYGKHSANSQLVSIGAELSYLLTLHEATLEEKRRYALSRPQVAALEAGSGQAAAEAVKAMTQAVKNLQD